MKKIVYFSLGFMLLSLYLLAQTPQAFKYQAVARDNAGNLIANQNVSFRISILQGGTGGTAVYIETHLVQTNSYGLANLSIGQGTIISGSLSTISWSSSSYFMKIEMDPLGGSSYQLMGTSQLLSVPYSLFSENSADSYWSKLSTSIFYNDGFVGIGTNAPDVKMAIKASGASDVFKIVSNSDNPLAKFRYTSNNSGALYLYDASATNTVLLFGGGDSYITGGRLGIGTNSPSAGLHVKGTSWPSSFIYVEGASGYDAGLRLYEGTDAKWHIFNNSALGGLQIYNSAAQTVFYANQSTTNVGIGVNNSEVALKVATAVQFDPGNYGDNKKGSLLLTLSSGGTQGLNMYGPGLAFSGINTGRRRAAISAIQTSSDADNVGLAFFTHPLNTTTNDEITQAMVIDHNGYIGIGEVDPYGRLEVSGDDSNPAVISQSYSEIALWGYSATSNGVYGSTSIGLAGSFNGNVEILGNLSKGSGSFVIDHPLDPENKILRHNFVESPENLLIYRGKIQLGVNGQAVVTMPDYFIALTMENEATVQLTPIGKSKGEGKYELSYEWSPAYDYFVVNGEPGRTVSWMVLADRDDPVIHQLGRPVEEEKGNGNILCDKGELLYPKAYGYPESRGKYYKLDQKYIRNSKK